MGILTILKTVVLAVLGKLAEDEVKAWLPQIAANLKNAAVRRLPKELRARYEEEWEGSLLEIPGPLSKIMYAASLLRAGSEIRALELGSSNWTVSAWRRYLDISAAVLVVAAIVPLFLVVAVAIRLTSQGPILERHPRVGLNGREFTMYKFRCQRMLLQDSYGVSTGESAQLTPLVLFLKRSSLDELPQLWSVLRGDMRLLGPAPQRPGSGEPPMAQKPGITRWKIKE